MHTLVCKIENAKWATYVREHESVAWSAVHTGHLRAAIDASLNHDLLTQLWTFSERLAPEVTADLLDAPEQTMSIAELRGYIEIGVDRSLDITIVVPEGREDDPGGRWAMMQRSPRDRLWGGGLDYVFRPQALRQQIIGFFGIDHPDEAHWKTFQPGKFGADRPSHRRELWVRPAWRARQLCPTDFPRFVPGFPSPTPAQQVR